MRIFDDKVAVITGGASGIGRALGELLARRGACVVLADRNGSQASEVAEQIRNGGDRAEAATVDVTDSKAVAALVHESADRFGRIDYLFNNAGIAVVGDARDTSLDDWNAIVDVNIRGVIHGVAAAYPVMIAQGSGHIVNTASIAGLIPCPGLVAYSASKHAVVGLSLGLRAEAAAHGVRVSAACPGFVNTPLVHNATYHKLDRDQILQRGPFKFYPVGTCARDIARGVAANEALIVVGGQAKLASTLARYAPALVRWYAERIARTTDKYRSAPGS